jgi:hypothetical protein
MTVPVSPKRNPAKPDRGAGTRDRRGRISPACPAVDPPTHQGRPVDLDGDDLSEYNAAQRPEG